MVDLAIFAVLLTSGFFAGKYREKKHYEALIKEEKNLLQIPVRADQTASLEGKEYFLVTGNVVIANDYFKTFTANIKNMFGGRLSVYESLMDRARREAVVRLKKEAQTRGAKEIVHLRITTSMIDQLGVEVLAIATAIK